MKKHCKRTEGESVWFYLKLDLSNSSANVALFFPSSFCHYPSRSMVVIWNAADGSLVIIVSAQQHPRSDQTRAHRSSCGASGVTSSVDVICVAEQVAASLGHPQRGLAEVLANNCLPLFVCVTLFPVSTPTKHHQRQSMTTHLCSAEFTFR